MLPASDNCHWANTAFASKGEVSAFPDDTDSITGCKVVKVVNVILNNHFQMISLVSCYIYPVPVS